MSSNLSYQGSKPSTQSNKKFIYIALSALLILVGYLVSQKKLGGSKSRQSCYHKFKVSPPGSYDLSKKKLKDANGQIVKSGFEQPLGHTDQNGSLAAIIQLTCGEEWQVKAKRNGFQDIILVIEELDDSQTHTHQMVALRSPKTHKVNSRSKEAELNDNKTAKLPQNKNPKKSKKKLKAKEKPKKGSWRKRRQQELNKAKAKAKRQSAKKTKQEDSKKEIQKAPSQPKVVGPKKQEVPINNPSSGLMF